MKTVEKMGAQGDVVFRRVEGVPAGAKKMKRKGPLVVAHSETGHHHVIQEPGVVQFDIPGNPLVCYLQLTDGLSGDGCSVVHQRPWDSRVFLVLVGLSLVAVTSPLWYGVALMQGWLQ